MTQTESNTYSLESFYNVTSTTSGTATLTETFVSMSWGQQVTCYVGLTGSFNSLGEPVHIHYEASVPATMYLLDAYDFSNLWTSFLGASPCSINSSRFQGSLTAVGDYDVNLPASDNPYLFVLVAPYGAPIPTVTITIGPMWTISSSAFTATAINVNVYTTTITSITQLELSFTQLYGSWIVAATLAVVIIVAVLLASKRKSKAGRKRKK